MEKEYQEFFDKFRTGLQLWSRTGKEPEEGDQDIRYFLDLQKKRLDRYGLKLKIILEPEGEVSSAHQISISVPVMNTAGLSQFNRCNYFQPVNRTTVYWKDEKKLYEKSERVTFYQTIMDPEEDNEYTGGSGYVCPECGAISTMNILQEQGCPYCGSRYLMKELYPKVTNFYSVEAFGIRDNQFKKHKKIILSGGLLGSLISSIAAYAGNPEFSFPLAAINFLIGAGIWMFLLYFIFSLSYLGRLIFLAGKSMPVVNGSWGIKKKITKKLKGYDPAFNYEYFEGRALSLARILLLNEDPDNYAQYEGAPVGGRFKDILDVKYRGGFGIDYIREKSDRIETGLRLYLRNTVYNGKKIKEEDVVVHMEMYHYKTFHVDEDFSIIKVRCPYCGGSFDARKIKSCPFCGREYTAGLNDWMVTKIRK